MLPCRSNRFAWQAQHGRLLAPWQTACFRFYASDAELHRLFKSLNGLVFPVSPPALFGHVATLMACLKPTWITVGVIDLQRFTCAMSISCMACNSCGTVPFLTSTPRALGSFGVPPCPQGGLTWLWLDSPYVIAARKLFNWALAANDAGNPFPVRVHACSHGGAFWGMTTMDDGP